VASGHFHVVLVWSRGDHTKAKDKKIKRVLDAACSFGDPAEGGRLRASRPVSRERERHRRLAGVRA